MKRAVIVLAMSILGGCASFNDIVTENNRHTTIGQELIDLKKAYDDELMTTEEYEEIRENIKAFN